MSGIPKAERIRRQDLFARGMKHCAKCSTDNRGGPRRLALDHMTPLSRGGAHAKRWCKARGSTFVNNSKTRNQTAEEYLRVSIG
jgi:hypothetical protein